MSRCSEIWAVIPAAGIGRRMQSDVPKQYLELVGRPVIEHTINRLLSVSRVSGAVVSLRDDDPWWPNIRIASDKPVMVAAGGEERCHSVMNALDMLAVKTKSNPETTWVLVHDAVRPCVNEEDVQRLIDLAAGTDGGGTDRRQNRLVACVDSPAVCLRQTPQRSQGGIGCRLPGDR